MKHLFQILSILGVGILTFVSCNKETGTEIPNEDFYTVQINLAGEVNVGYEPMTKSTSTDYLYAVHVSSTPDIELEEGQKTVWTDYANYYCIGTAPSTIKLAKGYKYSFMADIIVDDDNKLDLRTTNYRDGCAPWMLISSDCGEHFLISHTDFIYCTKDIVTTGGMGVDIDGERYARPNIDRYLGSAQYVPSENNMSFSIEMKRQTFGAKFVVTGNLATSGTIGIEIEGAPKQTLTLSEDTELNVHSDIYTFENISFRMTDEYTETVPVKLDWTRTDGTVYSIGTFDIVYQRNTTTVVTIVLDDDTISSGMGLVIPDSETGTMTEPGTNDVTIKDGAIQ